MDNSTSANLDDLRANLLERTKRFAARLKANANNQSVQPVAVAVSASENAAALPPLVIRGWNFATAITRWAAAGMPRRTQAEIDERLAICQACPFLQNDVCVKCGCACVEQNQLINKLALATESCPEGHWH